MGSFSIFRHDISFSQSISVQDPHNLQKKNSIWKETYTDDHLKAIDKVRRKFAFKEMLTLIINNACKPLHRRLNLLLSANVDISDIFVAHHQEVYCKYATTGTCCIFTVYLLIMGYKYARNM